MHEALQRLADVPSLLWLRPPGSAPSSAIARSTEVVVAYPMRRNALLSAAVRACSEDDRTAAPIITRRTSEAAIPVIGGNEAAAMLVLEPWSDDTTLWLAPPARLTLVIGQNHPDYYQALDEQDELVTGQVTDPATVATQVRLGVENGWWTIRWETIGAIEHPVSAKPAAWADLPRRARLIR